MKIFNIMKKNFRLLLRSRISALIVIFGPLVIILIVGLAFNSTGTAVINLGYYSPDMNNMTSSFISVLDKESYKLAEYESVESCKASLGSGKTHICVVFPYDFRIDNTKVNEIDFFVDNSKINFFQSVVDSIESDFNNKALELTTGMTQELLNKLNQTTEELFNKTSVIELLKQENIETKEDIDRVSDEIRSIDINFDYGTVGISDVEKSGDEASSLIDDLKDIAEDAIDEAYDLIDDVDDFAGGSNMSSSEIDELDDLLNSTAESLIELVSELNDTNQYSNSTGQLSSAISTLSSNLHALDTRLDAAARSMDVAAGKVLDLKKRVNASMEKILAVEMTFNAITTNIKNTQITNIQTIVSPIIKNVRPVVTTDSQLNFYFPYLIMLIIMFIGILLSSNLMIMEKTSRAYFRNFVTPTGDFSFILGAYLTTMTIMLIQLSIIITMFILFFSKGIVPNISMAILILFISTSIFTLIGMIIGNLLNSEETGTLTSISVGSILLFVSDLIFPLEKMPEYISYYANLINPFVVCSDLLRKAIVHNVSFYDIQQQLLVIGGLALALLLLVILSYKFIKRHFLLRYAGYLQRRDIKRQTRQQSAIKLLELMKSLPSSQHFITKDKKSLSNLKDLLNYIESLDKEDFQYYVDKEKNLFADWISHILSNEVLAVQLYKAKKKNKITKILSRAVKEFEKLEKLQAKKPTKHQLKYKIAK